MNLPVYLKATEGGLMKAVYWTVLNESNQLDKKSSLKSKRITGIWALEAARWMALQRQRWPFVLKLYLTFIIYSKLTGFAEINRLTAVCCRWAYSDLHSEVLIKIPIKNRISALWFRSSLAYWNSQRISWKGSQWLRIRAFWSFLKTNWLEELDSNIWIGICRWIFRFFL